MQEKFAERLRVIRARQGLTLVQAAERTGVDRHTLRDLELGRRGPYFPTVQRIAKGYGVPVEDLLQAEPEEREVRKKASAPDLGALSPEARRTLKRLLESKVDADVPWSVRDILALRDEFGQRFGFSNEEFASWLEQAGGAEESLLADASPWPRGFMMNEATARSVAGIGSEDDVVHEATTQKTQPPPLRE